MYEDKITEFKKYKEDLEISLSDNIVNYKMKEDELDTLLMIIEGMLVMNMLLIIQSRKKDKFDHNISRLSPENRKTVEGLVKEYKVFR